MEDSLKSVCQYVVAGFGFGLSLGFISYYMSYCASQVIEFFKTISR